MFLRLLYDEKLAQASYLIGSEATGEAVVVDPNRAVDRYLDMARREGLRVTHVTETHIHADFVSGSRELAQRAGARLYLSGAGGPNWQYRFAGEAGATILEDGSRFRVGDIELSVLHTPGHTPEHLTFLVTDTKTGADADGRPDRGFHLRRRRWPSRSPRACREGDGDDGGRRPAVVRFPPPISRVA